MIAHATTTNNNDAFRFLYGKQHQQQLYRGHAVVARGGTTTATTTTRRAPIKGASQLMMIVFAATLVYIGGLYYYVEQKKSTQEKVMWKVSSYGKPALGGSWSLVDKDGNLVTNKSFEGKWVLMYFGFAHCPDICPSEMGKMGQIVDMLRAELPDVAERLALVFVTVDPARDSIDILKHYGADFHPSFVYLTGTPHQVKEMGKKYMVYVNKAEVFDDDDDRSSDPNDYLVDHSTVMYMHDPDGEVWEPFTQSMTAKEIIDKLLVRVKEYDTEGSCSTRLS